MNTKAKEIEKNKLKLDVFVPLEQCACIYEHYITSVCSIIMEYMPYIDFKTKSLASDDAKKLNLHGNCVVLDETKVVKDPFQLRSELTKMLKAKGLQ